MLYFLMSVRGFSIEMWRCILIGSIQYLSSTMKILSFSVYLIPLYPQATRVRRKLRDK